MPIKKGNTNIGAIYKGTTQIAKVYKGTKLLFENAVWLNYLFEHIYHSLIPTAIDNKAVQDKAKLIKVEGNGVVENQNIPDNIAQVTIYGYTAQITNGVISITKNAAGDWGNMLDTDYILVSGHKYLYYDNAPSYAKIKLSTQGSPSLLNSGTITQITTTSVRGAFVRIDNETDSTGWTAGTTITFMAMIIDLTLMFGTGNEPTTLTDNRIQALLNRGYIAYNTGSYKNSRVGEIETFNSNSQLLDTITLNGLLELNGAINSHDTFEITNTDYVFTRNVGVVDLGSLSWSYPDNSFSAKLVHKNSGASRVSNMCCDKYITRINGSSYDIDKALFSANNSYIRIRDDSFNGDYSAFATAMSGVMLYYELATPQVITIPKKHLGCVDLGSLTWYYDNESGHENMFTPVIDNIAKPTTENIGNIYCEKYMTSSWTNLYIHNGKNIIAIQTNGRIRVYAENMGTNAADFKSAMAGIYLFYETDAEVSDFDNIAQINAGGSITSNSEVLPNVNFEIKCK